MKAWAEMSRQEKLAIYDATAKYHRRLEDALRLVLNQILMGIEGCTLRTTVRIMIDVDHNDDPRLP